MHAPRTAFVTGAAGKLACDCSKAELEPGYRAVPLGEMVADCVAWLAAEGLPPGVESAGPSA